MAGYSLNGPLPEVTPHVHEVWDTFALCDCEGVSGVLWAAELNLSLAHTPQTPLPTLILQRNFCVAKQSSNSTRGLPL